MNIAVTSPSFSKNKVLQERIYKCFPNAKLNLDGKRFSKGELIEFIKYSDGVIIGLEQIDEEVLHYCSNLKIVAKYGVGLDNIDSNACEKHDVRIGWTGGVNRLSVAEEVIGFMLALLRNIYVTSNQLKHGVWNKSGGFDLSGKTVGIIGVGFIGKEVIRLLKPFGCKILVNDIIKQDDYYTQNALEHVSKETLFKESDLITIHTPLTVETRNMINDETISLMKDTACIINNARGGIVNQEALKMALLNKRLAGAALDVYENEPPEDYELLSIDNLICTPHIGGNSKESVEKMGMSAISHLEKFFCGDNA